MAKIMMDDERHKRDFEEVSKDCPWKSKCKFCEQKECALFHFINYFRKNPFSNNI